jgi:fatty-acyl-CoA synthase
MMKMTEEKISSSTTLWNTWQNNALKYPDKDAIIHWIGGKEPVKYTYSQLINKANKYSIALNKIGIKKGEVCAIIMRHNPEFYPLYLGISGIGALPAVLAYPNPRLHPDKFRQGIEGMSQRSGLDWIFTEEALEEMIKPLIDEKKSTINGIHFPLNWKLSSDENSLEVLNNIRKEFNPDAPVLLQHSSGTTGLQKPVVLSHKAILDHVNNYGKSIKLTKSDIIVSWLPLYHDMGLIATYHVPLAFGITTILVDPFEWVLAPILLLEAVQQEKATLTWLPNFAYNILADKIRDIEMEGISLSSLRMIINCSEPVRNHTHEKFIKRFTDFGLNASALAASYAMAETTFAATQTDSYSEPKAIKIDTNSLAEGKVKTSDNIENTRVCVSSGRLIDGCEIRIVDEERNDLPAGSVGEIAIKSVSMFDGYRNYPEKTDAVLQGGWFYSGDYGFVMDDEYYVIGRKKDIIIVAGKNIYPEDIEDIMSGVPGLIPGRVIAFGEMDEEIGTELVSVVAETKLESEQEKKKLRMEIIRAGMKIDLSVSKIYLVPPRWLIKSSAGKPSRKANKERLTENNNEWIVK